jgi:uncharacterized SAM-binding protein YcdF (DUF218 family)
MIMKMKSVIKYFILFCIAWLVIHFTALLWVGLFDNVSQSDAVLIFGNKVETTGVPSERLKSRLNKGAELYKKNMAPLIIVSGGIGKEGYDEAQVMKDYLMKEGIKSENIITDNQGATTYATAMNLKKIAAEKNIESVIVVSQYYHILRSKLAIQKIGIDSIYGAKANMFPEIRDLYSIPREMVGYYTYLFKDYTK